MSASLIAKAVEIAALWHAGQVDKQGKPYILHPIRVMLRAVEAGAADRVIAAAVLHDVLEDTECDLDYLDLILEHAPTRFLVKVLTRKKGELYSDYIARVARDEDSAWIKIWDIEDNLSRISGLPEMEAAGLRIRYEAALKTLHAALKTDPPPTLSPEQQVQFFRDRAAECGLTVEQWVERFNALTPEEIKRHKAKRTPNTPEAAPMPNDRPHVWDLVIADMRERDQIGAAKYGTHLQAHNGRKPLVDAYQEALDLVVYLRQEIEERKGKRECAE